ncbi:hypothetical protein [Gelidibacter mesophilus]|uniref:hypothetical protein n=1 Tax=Gelidibacter mesophilus TaxID=169050 RepID=UPI0003FB53CF|nr:hypothetical protein [Gelidibacter mesophilus]
MELAEEDIVNIENAVAQGGDIWNNPLVANFKTKVKEYYRDFENEQCCYCKKNFQGEFNMVIDIEHILPKGKAEFRELMFITTNLNIACKRCNMKIKGSKTDFVFDINNSAQNHMDSANYRFIHPNVDTYFDHINFFQHIENDKKLIKYKIVANSEKGKYTYEYFKLNELEIDSINQAQGLVEKAEFSEKIDSTIQDRLRQAFKNI